MNNLSFFSYLLAGVGFSGLGFSTLAGGEDNGLPHVGSIIEPIEEVLPVVQKVKKIVPKVINPSNIAQEYDNLPCAKNTFPEISSWDEPEEINSSLEIKNPESLHGCLSVWWDKDETSDDEDTIIGNVLWSMSDGEFGTVLLSKVTVRKGKVVDQVEEKLVLLGEKTSVNTWNTLINRDESEEVDESDSATGWATIDLNAEVRRLDWTFVPENSSTGESTDNFGWIDEVSKWLSEQGQLRETLSYYERFNGRFEQEQEQ